MLQALKRWGGFCLILGFLLMGTGNVLVEFELVTGYVILHNFVLWGHGLLAFGIVGLAASLVNDNNRTTVMSATMLFIFANVLLGSGIGLMILQSSGDITTTIEEVMGSNMWATVNFMIAHFGYVIGLLILLASAVGNPAYSKGSTYILIFGTILVGIGPFTPVVVFAIGFALSLIGGVWIGKELLDDTVVTTDSAAEGAVI